MPPLSGNNRTLPALVAIWKTCNLLPSFFARLVISNCIPSWTIFCAPLLGLFACLPTLLPHSLTSAATRPRRLRRNKKCKCDAFTHKMIGPGEQSNFWSRLTLVSLMDFIYLTVVCSTAYLKYFIHRIFLLLLLNHRFIFHLFFFSLLWSIGSFLSIFQKLVFKNVCIHPFRDNLEDPLLTFQF